MIEKMRCGCIAEIDNPILEGLLLRNHQSEIESDLICPQCRTKGLLARLQAQADQEGLPRLAHEDDDILSGAAYHREANRLESFRLLLRLKQEYPPETEEDIEKFSRSEACFVEGLRPGQWSVVWNWAIMVQLQTTKTSRTVHNSEDKSGKKRPTA